MLRKTKNLAKFPNSDFSTLQQVSQSLEINEGFRYECSDRVDGGSKFRIAEISKNVLKKKFSWGLCSMNFTKFGCMRILYVSPNDVSPDPIVGPVRFQHLAYWRPLAGGLVFSLALWPFHFHFLSLFGGQR